MVSRSETARPLLTPGEVMQLPPADEIVMVAGTTPIRAKKARYYEDPRFQERILPPLSPIRSDTPRPDDWSALAVPPTPELPATDPATQQDDDPTGSERRRQPELNQATIVEKKEPLDNEFATDLDDDEPDDAARVGRMRDIMQGVARQASLDRGDGLDM
jgi:type IV secretion system protein VirD4